MCLEWEGKKKVGNRAKRPTRPTECREELKIYERHVTKAPLIRPGRSVASRRRGAHPLCDKNDFGVNGPLAPLRRFMVRRCRLPTPPQRHPPLLYDQATNQYPAGLFFFLSFYSSSRSSFVFLFFLFFSNNNRKQIHRRNYWQQSGSVHRSSDDSADAG